MFLSIEGSPPISLFQLPSYCGYSVKASGLALEVIAPYGACYIIQKVTTCSATCFYFLTHVSSVHYCLVVLLVFQNGSHILPLLWLRSPMKLSCPVQPATPAPSVFCSSSAMAVQMTGQEPNTKTLGVLSLLFTKNYLTLNLRQ